MNEQPNPEQSKRVYGRRGVVVVRPRRRTVVLDTIGHPPVRLDARQARQLLAILAVEVCRLEDMEAPR